MCQVPYKTSWYSKSFEPHGYLMGTTIVLNLQERIQRPDTNAVTYLLYLT